MVAPWDVFVSGLSLGVFVVLDSFAVELVVWGKYVGPPRISEAL